MRPKSIAVSRFSMRVIDVVAADGDGGRVVESGSATRTITAEFWRRGRRVAALGPIRYASRGATPSIRDRVRPSGRRRFSSSPTDICL
ncbi:hypothetical protein MBEHAL_2173 [Halarchaeum acidiphilum MH1-52-1]|uniref:Uncharacterized protein n=1 Tax=Halarchaeum acidiphilum MH1-52-1 TaxID=1261545 RepID=U3AF63_9EURY|nr:hypothetical protein MBEHAL_2173 [Halarchaeum acidiphilum MH1-52-1]